MWRGKCRGREEDFGENVWVMTWNYLISSYFQGCVVGLNMGANIQPWLSGEIVLKINGDDDDYLGVVE